MDMISKAELDNAYKVALHASEIAAGIINAAIDMKTSRPVNFEEKSSSADLVTVFDKRCEKEVLEYLHSATPTYNIVSEETRSNAKITATPTWVVDPIDGTMSFVHGIYDCCFSIGLLVNREPVLGVVNAPQLQMVFTAVKGCGAFCNGKPIHVSSTSSLKEAIILSHYSSYRSPNAMESIHGMHKELLLLPVHSIRCHGSAAVDMCLVASGKADVYIDAETNPWDIAAGTVILREAGGVVHDVDDASQLEISSRGVCCGNSVALSGAVAKIAKKYRYRDIVLGKL